MMRMLGVEQPFSSQQQERVSLYQTKQPLGVVACPVVSAPLLLPSYPKQRGREGGRESARTLMH